MTKSSVCSNRQIDDEEFVKLCGLLRKHELYMNVFKLVMHKCDKFIKFPTVLFCQLFCDDCSNSDSSSSEKELQNEEGSGGFFDSGSGEDQGYLLRGIVNWSNAAESVV